MPKRDWSEAIVKRDREGVCRVGQGNPGRGCMGPLQAAHVIARAYDQPAFPETAPAAIVHKPMLIVRAVDTVPLCANHHVLYDAHQLDLLPFLSFDEQAAAVSHVGIASAYRRVTGAAR